ncbi:hypothetical protein QVD17_30166 [Tagetes erecta]|uniref:Uncharacterized protein n=1 Tax=Tagetes erecta TaxID=13708 RepID=A0AAD8NMS6_TARER|nr:hypothetical protein QVD17_30166 [Tagetes erecta]
MGIYNQIFYTTLCSCILSLTGLILQGNLLMAIDFVSRHKDCFFDTALLSTVATASQFFISYTIRTFGALTFATIMTTRQLVSILLSCVWFGHPLSVEQFIGAVIVFGSLYAKGFLKWKPEKHLPSSHKSDEEATFPLKLKLCASPLINPVKKQTRGRVLLCRHAERSTESKLSKSEVVKAGGVGMILVDETDKDVEIPL